MYGWMDVHFRCFLALKTLYFFIISAWPFSVVGHEVRWDLTPSRPWPQAPIVGCEAAVETCCSKAPTHSHRSAATASHSDHPPRSAWSPQSSSQCAGRPLVHPSGWFRAPHPSRWRGPGEMHSTDADTLPILWVGQACSLTQVALTKRRPGLDR